MHPAQSDIDDLDMLTAVGRTRGDEDEPINI